MSLGLEQPLPFRLAFFHRTSLSLESSPVSSGTLSSDVAKLRGLSLVDAYSSDISHSRLVGTLSSDVAELREQSVRLALLSLSSLSIPVRLALFHRTSLRLERILCSIAEGSLAFGWLESSLALFRRTSLLAFSWRSFIGLLSLALSWQSSIGHHSSLSPVLSGALPLDVAGSLEFSWRSFIGLR